MSARSVIEHALLAYYADSRHPQGLVDNLLARYNAERDAKIAARSEKDTRGSAPHLGESTHRHPRPCEYPDVLPCLCPRPSTLPEESFIRARHRARIGAFFAGGRQGKDDAYLWVGELR